MTRLTLRFCMALLCCSHLPLAAQVQYTKEREDSIHKGKSAELIHPSTIKKGLVNNALEVLSGQAVGVKKYRPQP